MGLGDKIENAAEKAGGKGKEAASATTDRQGPAPTWNSMLRGWEREVVLPLAGDLQVGAGRTIGLESILFQNPLGSNVVH